MSFFKSCSKNITYIATIWAGVILVHSNKLLAEVVQKWHYYSDAEVSIVDNVYNNQSTLYGNGNNLFIISDDAIDNNNFYNAMVLNSINNTNTTNNNTNDTNSNNDYDIKFDGVVPKSVNYIYGRKSFDKPIDNTLMMVDVDNTTNDDYDTGNKIIYAVYSDMAEVANNKLYLNNGNFYIVNAMASEKGTVKNNTTVINNGSFQNLTNALTYTGSVENNSVYINNGVFDYIYGAMASNGGNVIGNKVYITGGKFSNNIIAGYATSPYSIIDKNIVVMDGNINIDNSFSIFGAKANKGKATNNKVVLGRNLKLEYLNPNYKLKIYGQYGAGNTYTTNNANSNNTENNNANNNTLEIYTKDINLYNIANFDNYYFILPENITNGDVIIKTNRTIKLDNANIGLALHKNLDLNKGDKITLFSNASGNFNLVDLDTSLLEFPEDIYVIKSNETTLTRSKWAIKYGVDIVYNDNNALELVVNDVEKLPVNNNTNTSNTNNNDINNANNTNGENNNNTLGNNIIIPELKPEALAMFNSREAILSVLDNDNIADIDGDFDFDNNNTNNSNNTDTFYYGYNNTNNNDNAYKNNRIDNITFFKASNINSVTSNGEKIEGYSMAMGMLFNTYRQNYFGIFMNVGNAEYKNNDFIYSSDVSENGSVEFVGIGGMAKYKLISTFNTFTYFDTNISGGTLRNKWNHLFVQNVGYDLSSIYFTGNLGVGIKFAINKWCESELYSKYFYTFVEGDNSNIGNDFVQFYDLKQQKIRIGNKWNVKISNNINNFLGFGVDIKKSLDYNDFGAVNYIPVNKYNNYRNFYTGNQQIVYNQSYDKHNEYDKVFYFEYGINFNLFRKKVNNIIKFRVDRYKFGNNKNKNLNYGTNNSRNYMADYANDNSNYNTVSGYANYAEKNNNRNTLFNISFSATYPF